MNLTDMPLLGMLREKMSWLNSRQALLSQNVANADTPGYAARDLKPVDFEETLRNATRTDSSSLRVTDPRHITIKPMSDGFEEEQTGQGVANGSGNTVAIEEEMIKVADTQAQYQAAANIYSKAISMMRTAIGHGG
jgi:flagellar basal-body rod protein FlgB